MKSIILGWPSCALAIAAGALGCMDVRLEGVDDGVEGFDCGNTPDP
jgi:hypothetical protein